MIAGVMHNNDRALNRYLGTRRAVDESSRQRATLSVVETNYDFDSGGDAFEELMALTPRPTAVICGNDILAVGAIQRARAMGIKVPGDVSITGFDDVELASVVEPPITTVHVPHRLMGRRAAEYLLAAMKSRDAPDIEELETYIVERKTLAPPPPLTAVQAATTQKQV